MKGDWAKGIEDFNKAIQFNPQNSDAFAKRGYGYYQKAEYQKGIDDIKEAIRLNPKDAESLNNLAWFRATCPDASVRDGKEAVEAGKKACELTDWKEWHCIGTLAAAYAEAGDLSRRSSIKSRRWELPV